MPRVSVVLPTYNRKNTIAASIKSVLTQTFADFELIIVDDGSTDGTESDIARIGDTRIRFLRHRTNQGVAEARNSGIREAHSPFIAFQDSDDEWVPEKLAKQYALAAESGVHIGIIYSAFLREKHGGITVLVPSLTVQKTSGNLLETLLRANSVTLQASLIKKECFERVGYFDSSLRILDDWEWVIRAAEHYDFLFLPEPLTRTHITPGNLTSQKKVRMNDREIIFRKHKPLFQKHPAALAAFAKMIGGSKLKENRPEEAREYFRAGLLAQPYNPYFIIKILATYI